jgi:copper chaperone NosL
MIVVLLAAFVTACGRGPRPIAYDADGCSYCRMQISDPRFGAELVTSKGKVYTFDSIECLVAFYRQASAAGDVSSVWVTDYRQPGTLIPALTATYVHAGPGRSPMGRGLVAVASGSDVRLIEGVAIGSIKRWDDIVSDTSAVGETAR